jgi:plastocyanin
MRETARLVCLLTVICASGKAGFAQKPAPRTYTVTIAGMKFQPASLTVSAGDTIVWKNADIVPHNIVGRGNVFTSPDLDPSETWKYVATKKGSFAYVCALHPNMRAVLIVR